MTVRPLRSVLYLPVANERAMAKAATLPCDAVVLDLEDAVAPERKEAARTAAAAAIGARGFGERLVVLRVNGLDAPWHADDLAAARDCRPDAVLLPKVNTPGDLATARRLLGDTLPLWAMVETYRAILGMADLAAAAAGEGLAGLVAGTNDLAKEMRCRLDRERSQLWPALTTLVMGARAAGLVALDGVCNAIGDEARLTAECRAAADLGFDGKTLIHPSQIEVANLAFLPSADEIAWARRVVEAFAQPDAQGRGAIKIDGHMVELLHLDQAHRVLAHAETA